MGNTGNNAENNKRMEVSQQQVSVAAAFCLLLAFFMFIAGVRVAARLTSDSFTDTMYTAFCSVAGLEVKNSGTPFHRDFVTPEFLTDDALQIEQNTQEQFVMEERYYARFGGYNTLKEADDCVQKLSGYGILVKPIARLSKTGSGKQRLWYAVVTQTLQSKEDLFALIRRSKQILKVRQLAVTIGSKEHETTLFGKERYIL